jgi:DNA-binding transcriptional ArsR family regulator
LKEEDRDFYRKLGSPIRREIVRLLGERGQMGATELNESVNISAGRFYYHLDFLGDLVTRDKSRKYILTERGKLAYQMLMGNDFTEGNPKSGSMGSSILKVLAPDSILNYVFSTKVVALPFAFSIIALSIAIQNFCHLQPGLLSLTASSESSIFTASVKYAVNFGIIFAFLAIASYAFGKRKGNLELFVGVAMSQIPLVIFSLLSLWFHIDLKGVMGMAVFSVFQLWSILILTVAMSRAKKLSYVTSGLVVLCLAYITSLLTNFLIISSF